MSRHNFKKNKNLEIQYEKKYQEEMKKMQFKLKKEREDFEKYSKQMQQDIEKYKSTISQLQAKQVELKNVAQQLSKSQTQPNSEIDKKISELSEQIKACSEAESGYKLKISELEQQLSQLPTVKSTSKVPYIVGGALVTLVVLKALN